MKTEVYSWRVSTEIKAGLQREARRRKMSLAAVLDLAAREWLKENSDRESDSQEQARLLKVAMKYVGTIQGNDPHRAENARDEIRRRLRKRHGR
jgi:uncharacterized membrane protein YccC